MHPNLRASGLHPESPPSGSASAPLSPSDGYKFDGGKVRWDLLPWPALASVAAVLTYGAKKYKADSWQSVPRGRRRYFAAAMRHLFSVYSGEANDPETGLPHLAHAACCVLFLLGLHLQDTPNCPTSTGSPWFETEP